MKATTRTHEENQERAYIAASRRSDRSVEARVESARRASEIHKKRTGKSLKVTEKDVLADEMYEEEDDELPAQYRNLNAHLQTGSSDFDARLQAYLANAVAFRKALSGVSKPGDKSLQADFVNKKQLADHTSLFPKHSDAWKDIVIPKYTEQPKHNDSSSSAYLPQGSSLKYAPYNSKHSGLGQRRLSTSKAEPLRMGTLRESDLKTKPGGRSSYTVNRRAAQQPSPPQSITPDYSTHGINYDAIVQRSSPGTQGTNEFPFSSRLPANAVHMLVPGVQTSSGGQPHTHKLGYQEVYGTASDLIQKPEDSIDATLVAPFNGSGHTLTDPTVPESIQWNEALWEDSAQQQDSASRKVLENDLWGSYMTEDPAQVWDWQVDVSN